MMGALSPPLYFAVCSIFALRAPWVDLSQPIKLPFMKGPSAYSIIKGDFLLSLGNCRYNLSEYQLCWQLEFDTFKDNVVSKIFRMWGCWRPKVGGLVSLAICFFMHFFFLCDISFFCIYCVARITRLFFRYSSRGAIRSTEIFCQRYFLKNFVSWVKCHTFL